MRRFKIAFKKEDNRVLFGQCKIVEPTSLVEIHLSNGKKAYLAQDQIAYMIETEDDNNSKFYNGDE